ncbi:MAG: hypothetical protein ACLFSQ_10985 [Candidatus Zixiibacteriota bacterium]
MHDEEKKKLKSNITTVILVVILIILITPVKKSRVYVPEKKEEQYSLPNTSAQEIDRLHDFIEQLRSEKFILVQDNYPTSLHFKWTGATFSTSPASKADEIALTLYHRTGRSVRILLTVGGKKYSGLYRPQ